MTYAALFIRLKHISKNMLQELGIPLDESFPGRVSDMAGFILEDLYNKGYTFKQIDNAIKTLEAAARLFPVSEVGENCIIVFI